MNNTKIVLVGTGAQAKYVLDIFTHYEHVEVLGMIDISEGHPMKGKNLHGSHVLGGLDDVNGLKERDVERFIVCCSDSQLKARLTNTIRQQGFQLVNAVHPGATIAGTARIGKGVIINAGAVIQPFAQIGNGVMIHANVIVEHDNVIEDYTNLAPGVSLAGWVTVKQHAVINTGAVAIPSVTVGVHAIVGAGAVVIKDVPDRAVVVGSPARIIKYKEETN